ncbi:MAG: hypothetical protein ACREGG_01300 [Candidatus Saccharimonadales bacterium]
MKTYKKIWLGLAFIFVVLGLITVHPPKSHAATTNKNDVQACINTAAFQDIAHITCVVNGKKIVFTDVNPTDSNPDATACSATSGTTIVNCSLKPNFAPLQSNGQWDSSIFCNPGDTGTSEVPFISGGYYYHPGITGRIQSGSYTTASAGSPASVEFNLGYTNTATNKCTRYPDGGSNGIDATISDTAGIANILQFFNYNNEGEGSGIESLSGVKSNTALGGKTYGLLKDYGGSAGGFASLEYVNGFTTGKCGGDVVLVTIDNNAGSVSATRYPLTSGNQDLSAYPDLLAFANAENIGPCSVSSNSGGANFGVVDTSFSLYGSPPTINTSGQICTGTTCVTPTTTPITPNSPGTCESASSTGFEWIICPALRLFDSMVNTFTNILENLLDFNTSQYLNGQIKSSWSIMRTISSAVLVIIMLIAVIAQAVGGGPIDAYTLRKILPRLVVAVILIQISWVMLVWFINLADDLGHGVRDLISAPFGGWQNLDLAHLIYPLGGRGVLTVTALFTSMIAVIAFSGLTIAGIGLLGLSALLTDLVAFVFLVLRQVFVVMAVILFPIALIAWILPGTQRYWKLWADNFIKLLLLFPMIMALIYGGRIFAHVFIAANANSTIGVFVLFIGFFGPYWFLPKAFRWGGQLFAAASSGAMDATKGLREFPRKYAMGKAKEEREFRANQRRIRLGENTSAHPRWDTLLTGGYNFTRSRRHREQAMNASRAAGRKSTEEEAANALTGSPYEQLDHPYKLDSLRTVAQGEYDQRTGLDGRNAALRRWAMDQLATFGDWDIISELRDRNQVDERTWQMFVAKNISGIHQNAPHLSPQRTDLSQQGYEEFGMWKDLELSEYRRQFRGDGAHAYVRDAQTGQLVQSADTATQRLRMYTKARQALADDQVRRRMTAAGIAELEGIVNDVESGAVAVGSPTVSVSESSRGVQGTVFLPDDLGTLEAHDSLRVALTGNNGASVAATVANRVADSPPNSPDEQAFRDILTEIRGQALDPATGAVLNPQAREQYNRLLRAYHERLEQRALQTETQSFQVGHTATQADAELTAEVGHGNDKIDSLGLDEI